MEQLMNFSLATTMSLSLLEALKWVVRKIKKDPTFDFPAKFYLLVIPGLNTVVALVLAFAGFEGYTVPVDGASWMRGLVIILAQSIFQVFEYENVVAPMKQYRKELARGI